MESFHSPSVDEPSSGHGLGWVLAILGPIGATGLGLLLAEPHVLPPFLVAIAGASLVGGIGPGLCASLLSGLAVNYWFFPPNEQLGFASQGDVVSQLVFWASSLLVAALCAWSRAWRLRAEAEVGTLGSEKQADRAQIARMQLALDRSALEEAVRQQTAREQAALADVERERARATEEQQRREEEWRAQLERTVLVADDDAYARRLACHALETGGYRWLSACDGTEALELVDRYDFPVEVALVEATLPDMTGGFLAERLESRHPGIAVLFTSTELSEHLVEQGILRAADPLLRKPFTPEGLLRAIHATSDQFPVAEVPDSAIPSQ